MERTTIFTIGHSDHPVETFITLLVGRGITAVADVRSAPYSRRNPGYNREFLAETLKKHGIRYAFFGRQLGARPQDPSYYEDGRVQYRRLATDRAFKAGI